MNAAETESQAALGDYRWGTPRKQAMLGLELAS